MLVHKYMEQKSRAAKRSAGQQVSHQMWIWGICCARQQSMQAREYTLALKPREDVTRSPKRVSVAPQKGLISPKNIFEKKSLGTRENLLKHVIMKIEWSLFTGICYVVMVECMNEGMWLVECCKHVSLHSSLWVFCFTETQPSRDRASSTRRSTWRTYRSTRRTVPSTSSSTTRYPGLSFSR